jgi:hypothetical protein
MSENDEFSKADQEAGVAVLPPESKQLSGRSNLPANIIQFRNQLVEEYHGAGSLAKKLKADGRDDMESLLLALIEEVVKETDHLLGNELVSTHNGELRDASIISFKRSEVLEKAMKAIQTKLQFEKQSGIDIESPSMIVVFRFFISKAKEAFNNMGVDTEIADLFFTKFGEVTNDWKKELRENFEALRSSR